MRLRVILVTAGLLVGGGWLLGHSLPRPLILAPKPKFDFPDPKWKFTCPEGWTCPDSTAPHTWRPPGHKDPYEHEVLIDPEVKA